MSTNPTDLNVLDPDAIRRRMDACRDEFGALKKLLRAAEAARKASELLERQGQSREGEGVQLGR